MLKKFLHGLPCWRPLRGGIILLTSLFVTACGDGYQSGEWDAQLCRVGPAPGQDQARNREASDLLARALADDNGSGIAAAVMRDGQLLWSDAVGRAAAGAEAPLTRRASMRLGSVSKPLTAGLVARLVALDMLDLDVPIQHYVPEFPEKQQAITLRHLLNHTSGIRHYDFSSFAESNSQIQYAHAQQALAVFKDDPLLFDPGEQFHYSSFGYNLVGAAVENVTGMSFGEALQVYLARPLSLSATVADDPAQFVNCRPDFNTVLFGRFAIPTIWRNHSDAYPSAGILASAEDLARFAQAFFREDLVPDTVRAEFTRAALLNDGSDLEQSAGWEMETAEDGSISWYGHGGETNGAYASLRYYPEQALIVTGISSYNYWLTSDRPRFFSLVREELPALFAP